MSCESSDHIRTYRLPKQAQPFDNDLKGKNEFVLKWETPEMWTEVKGHSMRLASFTVPTTKGEGDLSITTFSGESGGIEANVNRWLGQIGLEPLSLIEIQKISLTSRGKLGDYQYHLTFLYLLKKFFEFQSKITVLIQFDQASG